MSATHDAALDGSLDAELVDPNPPTSFFGGFLRIWRDIHDYRHLVTNFIQRDLRLKFRGSTLGYFWSILEPLMLSGVYVVLFTILAGKPRPMYPLWVIIGVLTWNAFGRILNGSLSCLTDNEGLIKQVYFPRSLFAVTIAGSQIVMAGLSLLVSVPFLIYFRIAPTPGLAMVPLGLMLIAMFGLGLGLGLAPLNVVFRDIEFLFRFVVRAGFYLSPVMWTFHMLPKGRSAAVVLLNPMSVPISMVRSGIDGTPLDIPTGYIIYSLVVCTLVFLFGIMIFQRYEARVVKKL